MLAHRAGRAGQAIGGHLEVAAAASPPLAQVRQPLGVITAQLVPDREIGGDGLVCVLDPDGDVGTVVFGHGQLRDLQAQREIGGIGGAGEQRQQGNKAGQTRHSATPSN
jgi:hypothetical protein